MPTWLLSGAAVRLLAVMCVTAGCAVASQQQEQPSAVFSTTPDELWRFIEQAVRVELQPLIRKLESRVDALDGRLVKLDSRVDQLTVRLFDNSQNPQPDELSSRLDGQQSQLDKLVTMVDGQKSQLNMLITKVDGQTSQLESLTTRLGRQESQLTRLVTKQDSQQSQLTVLTDTSSSEQSRLDRTSNKTASQQTQVDMLAIRLDQMEGERGPAGSEPLPRDCNELPASARSGIHMLQPGLDRSLPPVAAYCDLVTDGGKWTVVQRRANIEPHQDFYLGWAAYKEGFGELRGEFWWGLESLWRLTSAPERQYQLRIDMESFEGDKRHALYQSFKISSEEDGYRLLSADSYTGDAGDSLHDSVNMKFSTRDRDQDIHPDPRQHCAQWFKGAWWFTFCGTCNLNGRYLNGPADSEEGIWWRGWKGSLYSMKKVEMKIRRI